jgi:hypothetical protein
VLATQLLVFSPTHDGILNPDSGEMIFGFYNVQDISGVALCSAIADAKARAI